MPNLFNPGDWVVTRTTLPGIAMLTPCQILDVGRLASGEPPLYAVVSLDGVEAKIPHHLLRAANEPSIHPVKREENPMGYLSDTYPALRHTHVEIEGKRYEIQRAYSSFAEFIRINGQSVCLTTLDSINVKYKRVTPNPFDDLAPGLYANAHRPERLFRKNADGTWEIADPRSTYVPARWDTLEAGLRYTFEIGNLKPVTIG